MSINQLQCVKLQSLKCQSITMSINHNVSNYIHRSLMSAVMGEKSMVILLSMGVHSGLTLGPLCCLFIGGL